MRAKNGRSGPPVVLVGKITRCRAGGLFLNEGSAGDLLRPSAPGKVVRAALIFLSISLSKFSLEPVIPEI
ncbi:hypothetical protein [Burkholderia sp. Bp9143]|uniref:hypothetical protein n=1 Tax=Burkholderia sp. Bp9143 TaxID=2184574 RepID=UPI000F5B17C7|nr:hypothetical protein [Burkholderia sp. Bp9143]